MKKIANFSYVVIGFILFFCVTVHCQNLPNQQTQNFNQLDLLNATIGSHDNNYNNMMSAYYQLKIASPEKANALLNQILLKYPNSLEANKEMGYVLIENKQPKLASNYFHKALTIDPNDVNAKQQLYYLELELSKNKMAAKKYSINRLPPSNGMDTYYTLKNQHKYSEAQAILYKILAKNPNNREALLELGYLSLDTNNPEQALDAFERAQVIDYNIVMEKAYILEKLKRYDEAYDQFEVASTSTNRNIIQESENSMIYLAPETYKVLPNPWFADLYFAPEYHSHFDDAIFPLEMRAGISLENNYQILELYGTLRATIDTKSSGTGLDDQFPDIYQDNAAILGVGIHFYPYKKIPIYFYAEVGEAYDLIYQDENRWNFDFRTGVSGYQNWGAQPVYAIDPRFVLKHIGDFYGDIGYYSRYDNNIIGQLRLREGIRFFEYKNSSFDLYAKAEYFFDTKQEYYNNLVDLAPGIAFTPYNHWNLVIRVEPTFGHYIPVNSPDENPYGSNYFDMVILAEYYIRI